MDFHAFKRSKALLRPVCLWAGTVKTHQFLWSEAWRAMWLSLYLAAFSPLSIHANSSTRGNFQHSPDQSLKQSPTGEQWKAFPALPLSSFPAQAAKQTCYPPQGDRREGARKGKRQLLLHTQQLLCLPAETREKPPDWCLLPSASVSAQVSTFVKDREQQGQGQPLTITLPLGRVSCYENHWETSITPTSKISKVELSKGGTRLFLSSASMY